MMVESAGIASGEAAVAAVPESVMLPGSSSSVPNAPFGARVSAVPREGQRLLARHFDEAAVAGRAPPRAMIVPANVGRAVGPHDHLAAVADRGGRGVDRGRGVDAHRGRGRDRPGLERGLRDRRHRRSARCRRRCRRRSAPCRRRSRRRRRTSRALISIFSPVTWMVPPLPFLLAVESVPDTLTVCVGAPADLGRRGRPAEHDLAVAVADRARLDHAGVVDDGIDHGARRRRRSARRGRRWP